MASPTRSASRCNVFSHLVRLQPGVSMTCRIAFPGGAASVNAHSAVLLVPGGFFKGLKIVDVRDPARTQILGSFDGKSNRRLDAWRVTLNSPWAYVLGIPATRRPGLWVVNTLDPAHSIFWDYYAVPGVEGGITIEGNTCIWPPMTNSTRCASTITSCSPVTSANRVHESELGLDPQLLHERRENSSTCRKERRPSIAALLSR